MNSQPDDLAVSKIGDERLVGYTQRLRSGSTQVFYTGDDERDFDRYRREGMVKMHDKPDTIRIEPPERHLHAVLRDGEWWWVNGCAQCNGRPRDWMTYVECKSHDVCRCCGISRSGLKEAPWGGKHGWICQPCELERAEALKQELLLAVSEEGYDRLDYMHTDEIKCPHCASQIDSSDVHESTRMTCDFCGGDFQLDVEYTASYSTTVIGERLLPRGESNEGL